MSSWCRSHEAKLAAALLLALSGAAGAQQVYFQPLVQVGVEGDTNRNLVTSGSTSDGLEKKAAAGYDVDASGILGIATPTTDTILKPEVAFSDFPSLDANDLRTNLDFNSQIRSARSQASILGQFSRESTYSSELANPQINEVANLPNTPETGRISVDTDRTLITVAPTYTVDLSQRLNWAVNGTYQDVSYSGSNSSGYVPFDYYQGGTSLIWLYDQRLTPSLGAFASHESSKDQSGQVNAYGVDLGLDYKLSTQFTNHLQLSAERDYSALRSPIYVTNAATTNGSTTTSGSTTTTPQSVGFSLTKAQTTGIGATYSTNWVGQIQKLQLSIGRTYTPNGNGGTFAADQLQVQYQRDLSPRLQLIAAARYVDETSVSAVFRNDDYSYVNAETNLKWKMTPTWFLSGGLEYVFERFRDPVRSPTNGVIYVAVGYQGLGKRT